MLHLTKSFLFNLSVIVELFLVAYVISFLDAFLALPNFKSNALLIVGLFVMAVGFGIRTWASATFYKNKLSVVKLKAQGRITNQGPYRFSRNPLYVGLVLMFLGATLFLGVTIGIIIAVIHFVAWHIWVVKFEEKSLEKKFGEEYVEYKKQAPRWL